MTLSPTLQSIYAVCEDAIRSGQRPPWWLLADAYEDEGGEQGEWMAATLRWCEERGRQPGYDNYDTTVVPLGKFVWWADTHDLYPLKLLGDCVKHARFRLDNSWLITSTSTGLHEFCTLQAAMEWLAERLKQEDK